MSNIRYVKGDATKPNTKGECHSILVHIVNNCGQWGAGFVLALSAMNKKPELRYRSYLPQYLELGTNQVVRVAPEFTVINMIAQDNTDYYKKRKGDYNALALCLESVFLYAKPFHDKYQQPVGIHMPRIGCGIGGGTWDTVEYLIETNLVSEDVNVTVYDLE